MVRSRRCRTTVLMFSEVKKRSKEILRSVRRETSETKYEGGVQSRLGVDSLRNGKKKNYAVDGSTGNSRSINRFSTLTHERA